jgi:hypothetical protein
MSDLTFTKIEQSIKGRKRPHLTFLKSVTTHTRFWNWRKRPSPTAP